MMERGMARTLLGLTALGLAACDEGSSEGGAGKLRVILAAEASITGGLDQGSGSDDTRDYDVRFSKYLIAVGNVRLGKSSTDSQASLQDVYVADLQQVGEQGVELGTIDDLQSGQWDEFGYATPRAPSTAKAVGGATAAEVAKMRANGWTYWIEGNVLRDESEGGPVSFVIQTAVDTVFSNCEVDGEPGVSLVAGGPSTVTLTIHGDHLFFNTFPSGSEGSIKRLAGWVFQADANTDGKVTTEELSELDATEVFKSTAGYSLDGKPKDLEINTALDFVRAQLATQGHVSGEGECIATYRDGSAD